VIREGHGASRAFLFEQGHAQTLTPLNFRWSFKLSKHNMDDGSAHLSTPPWKSGPFRAALEFRDLRPLGPVVVSCAVRKTPGLKPPLLKKLLRGAKAPLFHSASSALPAIKPALGWTLRERNLSPSYPRCSAITVEERPFRAALGFRDFRVFRPCVPFWNFPHHVVTTLIDNNPPTRDDRRMDFDRIFFVKTITVGAGTDWARPCRRPTPSTISHTVQLL